MTKLILFLSLFALNAFCCDKQEGIKNAQALIGATAHAFGAYAYIAGQDLLPLDEKFDHVPYALYFQGGEMELGHMLVNKELCYSIPGPSQRKNSLVP